MGLQFIIRLLLRNSTRSCVIAQLPVIQQLSRQDFPEAPTWISKLLYPLQLFMTNVLNALRNQLTFQENFSCVIKQFSMVAGATETDNIYAFQWPIGRQVIEVSIYASNGDGTYTPVFPQVSWNYINGQVSVNAIRGLTATI
jgi:hypothetical protein